MNWTSEKPTVAGWYWWRNLLTDNAPEVWAIVDHGDGLEVVGPFDETALDEWVSDMGGEWQGPITPDSYQQGWVAGLQEAGDLHEQVNTYCDHEPKAGAGGMGVAIRYRDLIRQQATKLAQQAQDEKGGGDGKDCL